MADPLSVAGLAAGLVSLGLQVCGSVIAYIDALDCREQDLASLRHQHNSVYKTLQRTHQRATAAVRSCLDACHAELEDLNDLVVGFSTGTRSETSRREKLRSQGKKLLYPFSRPKLEHLETRLRNANAALQLALQALGLSVSQLGSEQLAELESISRTMSTSLSAISTPVNSLHTRLDSLENLMTQLVVHSPVLSSRVATAPLPRKSRAPTYPGPLNQPPTATAHTLRRPISPATPHGGQFQTLVSSFTGGIGTCICRPLRILKRDFFGWGPVGLSFETAGQKHLPGCPISQTTEQDQTRTIGLKYTGLRHLLGSVIELSLAMKSGPGSWAISPNFTYHPTVDPMTAPAFQILKSLEGSLLLWEKLVALALAKILRLFQAGKASPLSVDSANRSLAHVAAVCPLIELLRYLIRHNVPANQYDLRGSSPLSTLFWYSYGSTSQYVEASELILRSGSETYGCGPLCLAVLANDTTQVEFLLEHYPSTLGERTLFGQSPLHLAVKHPSCLRLLVRAAGRSLLDLTDDDDTSALEAAVKFSSAQCNQKRFGRRCRRCHCAESATMLIKAGCAIPVTRKLHDVLRSASLRCKRRYIRCIRDRREDLKRLARDNLSIKEAEGLGLFKKKVLDSFMPQVVRLLEQRGVEVPELLSQPTTRVAPINYADLFFKMGFHDFDFSQQAHAENQYLRYHNVAYLRWLDEHGVDILSQQVESVKEGGATMAFFTFGRIGMLMAIIEPRYLDTYIPWFEKLVASALSAAVLDTADTCHCECWPGGCSPLSSFLISVIKDAKYRYRRDGEKQKPQEEAARCWAWSLRNMWRMTLEPKHHYGALRLMTFHALQMRHTCCRPYLQFYGLNGKPRGRPDLVVEGHTPEKHAPQEHTPDQLALLEDLMEEFGRELAPILAEDDEDQKMEVLVNFWENTWPKRMVEIREQLEGDKLSEEERRRAEEIGVVWDKPAGPEVLKNGGNPYEKTTEEYWFYEIDQIVVD
ncbi:hypothetical protein C8A05DRAFT_47707 [Staphylotrichum tortipilum]|uniref:Ankyrin repeat protein n=1 Tax=Staphylotrichum tortipilum TaxID=2831512 RepID=A0AAN6MC79_9PEZI|nr:hypothetical protein C8A05DRAFT_47707 [Staphylotrichum longicolle]